MEGGKDLVSNIRTHKAWFLPPGAHTKLATIKFPIYLHQQISTLPGTLRRLELYLIDWDDLEPGSSIRVSVSIPPTRHDALSLATDEAKP